MHRKVAQKSLIFPCLAQNANFWEVIMSSQQLTAKKKIVFVDLFEIGLVDCYLLCCGVEEKRSFIAGIDL